MPERSPTHCSNCGAPLEATASKCRFCQQPIQGRSRGSAPALPTELRAAIERLRSRQGNPTALYDHLAAALPRLVPRSTMRSSKSALEARLGTIAYTFRKDGAGLIVERQSVAGGFGVGMKDALPASRWPELLVVDIANHADATGQDWKAAVATL